MADPSKNSVRSSDDPISLVLIVKKHLDITSSIEDMTDDEIRRVCRFIGDQVAEAVPDGTLKSLGRRGVETMLSVALYVFPDYYERYGLAQMH